jgi:hypothetical protein
MSIRFDQNLPQGKNWPTEYRIRQNRRRNQKWFILCGVVAVTFRVLSLFVVTKWYSYSKIESVITNCSSAWWISNKSDHLIWNPLITCHVTRIHDNIEPKAKYIFCSVAILLLHEMKLIALTKIYNFHHHTECQGAIIVDWRWICILFFTSDYGLLGREVSVSGRKLPTFRRSFLLRSWE